MKEILNVLVACEESQAVSSAFRLLGHNAFSCDLQKCSGGHPEYHILGDCLSLLNGCCSFTTEDGVLHSLPGTWDLIVAHPPCTFLTKAGSQLLFESDHSIKDMQRFRKGLLAARFFMEFFHCNCPYVAIENPIPMRIFKLPRPSQLIQPYFFGHNESKATLLWLRNLPPLMSTVYVGEHRSIMHRCGSAKSRSKTYSGIAAAMALQWSDFILFDYSKNNIKEIF